MMFRYSVLVLVVILTAGPSYGATSTWSAGRVAGDSSIVTDGDTMVAVNSGGPTTTVGGVTFVAGGANPLPSTYGGFYPTGAFSPQVNTLLTSASFGPGPATFQLPGLTIGNDYIVQLFATDDRVC